MLPLADGEKKGYDTVCFIYVTMISVDDIKVKDHCHMSRLYRGPENKFKRTNIIPVFH